MGLGPPSVPGISGDSGMCVLYLSLSFLQLSNWEPSSL